MPDTIAWAVDDIVELLKHADMAEILKDFGKGKGKEDPVVHFYETFLAAYDPKMREIRGVYYTPEPVVSYIVRSIDHLLKTRFNRPKGLADENTLILDPATGTGHVPLLRHRPDSPEVRQANGRVGRLRRQASAQPHLRLRVAHGPVCGRASQARDAVAGNRLQVRLRPAARHLPHQHAGRSRQEERALFAGWVADEANAAAEIKRDKPILVVLGNPPYSGVSANRGDWITNLVADYREVDGQPLGEKKVWLKNDYIKFIRFGQWRISAPGTASWPSSPTIVTSTVRRFAACASTCLKTFDEIYILNLHGNSKRRETAPDGAADENVFDITQGVAIAIFRETRKAGDAGLHYADFWGERAAKYEALSESDVSATEWQPLSPAAPFYEFVPVKHRARKEYNDGWRVNDIFPVGSNGVQTSRDIWLWISRRMLFLRRMESSSTRSSQTPKSAPSSLESNPSATTPPATRAAGSSGPLASPCNRIVIGGRR